ncbi:helix-turn-helix transcriptional regulator [Zoogloea sp.]|uniref:helix-turn-helix transcriptional regulator n=1 Tax=Zoogloea sp. TaxID=49181 RepID=UPI0032205B5B
MTPLRHARKRKNMTQSALARSAGVSQAHISAIETGRCSASAELAERLVHAIGPSLISEAEILYPERFRIARETH